MQKKCIQLTDTEVLATREERLLPGFDIMGTEDPSTLGRQLADQTKSMGMLEAGDPTPPQHCRKPELYQASEHLPCQPVTTETPQPLQEPDQTALVMP